MKPRFLTRPESFRITWLGDRWFRLDAPIVYRSSIGLTIEVPGGFVCDLSSVPRWAAWLAGDWRRTCRGGALHDFGYRRDAKPSLSRRSWDLLGAEAWQVDETDPWRVEAMYAGVRVAAWRHWHKKDVLWGGP